MTATKKLLYAIPLPDALYRMIIRAQLRQRLKKERCLEPQTAFNAYMDYLRKQPITVEATTANQQHYEVPTEFYDLVLGKNKKYSCCLWSEEIATLDQAEVAMLDLSLKRAQVEDGHQILDLGCGWGSMSLYCAKIYPNSHITAVSNSSTQKTYIMNQAQKQGLTNITVITEDVARIMFEPQSFDRIITIEMLEHVRNYDLLFSRLKTWLKSDGQVFIHIFGHRNLAYSFDDSKESSWMARHFFSGGQMPSEDLLERIQSHLCLEEKWTVNGGHYQKTCQAWLKNMDIYKNEVKNLFEIAYKDASSKMFLYWRLFFMACEELFGCNQGKEWQVYHYVFKNKDRCINSKIFH